MSSFKLLAAASLVFGSLALGGCISNTEGSTPEDFQAQNNSAAAAAAHENDDTESNVQPNCPDEACEAVTVEKRALVINTPVMVKPAFTLAEQH